jgi:hypothetical protein
LLIKYNLLFISFIRLRSLQDGPKNNWNPTLISDIINDYVTKHKIDIVSIHHKILVVNKFSNYKILINFIGYNF